MRVPEIKPIAKDFRGSSWSVLLPDGTEGVLIYTKKGAYRGGHYHTRPECSLLLSGQMKYRKMLDGEDVSFVQSPGDLLRNEPGEPHLALALESGWLFDWKLGAKKGEWKTVNYAPYRKEVEEQER